MTPQYPRWAAVTPTWGSTLPPFALSRSLSRVSVEVGGINMVGTPHAGTCFLLRSIHGWWAGGAPRGGGVPNPHGDGGVRGRVDMGARTVSLQGMILTQTGEQQMEAFDTIAATKGGDRWLELTVTEHERKLSRSLMVAPSDVPDPQPVSDTAARFDMTFQSDDYPLLSAENVVSVPMGGSAPIQNEGNYSAKLEAMFYGPLTQPRLRFGGAVPGMWRYGANINTEQRLQVEFDRRIVRNPDTQGHSRVYASGDWPSLAPGQTTFHLEGSGIGRVELRWRSAWN